MFTNLELKDQWNKDMTWIKCNNNFLFTFSESLPGFNVVWWNWDETCLNKWTLLSVLQTFPFFGVVPAILNESGEELEGPSEGYLVRMNYWYYYYWNDLNHDFCVSLPDSFKQVFKQPWPGVMRTVYGNHQRFETTYFKKFPGYYVTGDGETRSFYFYKLFLHTHHLPVQLEPLRNGNKPCVHKARLLILCWKLVQTLF